MFRFIPAAVQTACTIFHKSCLKIRSISSRGTEEAKNASYRIGRNAKRENFAPKTGFLERLVSTTNLRFLLALSFSFSLAALTWRETKHVVLMASILVEQRNSLFLSCDSSERSSSITTTTVTTRRPTLSRSLKRRRLLARNETRRTWPVSVKRLAILSDDSRPRSLSLPPSRVLCVHGMQAEGITVDSRYKRASLRATCVVSPLFYR